MEKVWNVLLACVLSIHTLCCGAALPDTEPEDEPQKPRLSFSAEILFPDTMLTPIEEQDRLPEQNAQLDLTQQLLVQIKKIESGRAGINDLSMKGMTPLMLAAKLRNRLVVCYLVAAGADVRTKDRTGRTVADYALDPRSRELVLACQEEDKCLTDDEIAYMDELTAYSEDEQRARLWDSVCYPSNVKEVADLMKYGVEPEGVYRDRLIIESPFLQPECLAWLIRRGYDVNTRRPDGSSPFCIISGGDNLRLMLAMGMQPDMGDADERALVWKLLKTNAVGSALAAAGEEAKPERESSPRVEVYFDRAYEVSMPTEHRHNSLGASGYLFTGRMELWDENGECVVTQNVQSGGWMSANSPFRRSGNYPRNPRKGAYDPTHYPDTAFPVLTEETVLATRQTTELYGYAIPNPPDTGRTGLMVHSTERLGSEGCISASKGVKWAIFCSKMEQFHDMGIENIPLRVTYLCESPDPTRRSSDRH